MEGIKSGVEFAEQVVVEVDGGSLDCTAERAEGFVETKEIRIYGGMGEAGQQAGGAGGRSQYTAPDTNIKSHN